MQAIQTLNSTTGQEISAILPATMKIFTPLLLSNAISIKSITPHTISYGSHPRQALDIYPPPPSPSPSPLPRSPNHPILVFLHGGGLIRGDKNLSLIPENLVYANIGSFFAKKGFVTLVMNYRRVNSETPEGGKMGEDAMFPSGGEDVSLVLEWVEREFGGQGEREQEEERNVFLMGNSAGGVHASTFILAPQFEEQRKSLFNGEKGVRLKGLINLAVPTHFHHAAENRKDMLETYYGLREDIEEKSPCGLLNAIKKSGRGREECGVPPCLAVLGTYDPEDEIAVPMRDFVELWSGMGGSWGRSVELKVARGHNHISLPLAVGCGEGEEWAEDVVGWMGRMGG